MCEKSDDFYKRALTLLLEKKYPRPQYVTMWLNDKHYLLDNLTPLQYAKEHSWKDLYDYMEFLSE